MIRTSFDYFWSCRWPLELQRIRIFRYRCSSHQGTSSERKSIEMYANRFKLCFKVDFGVYTASRLSFFLKQQPRS